MPELSQSDREEMRRVAEQALAAEEGGAKAVRRTPAEVVDLDSIKDFFCEHWDSIKKVLLFIADKVGGKVAKAIRAIIAAGDFLHGKVCSG